MGKVYRKSEALASILRRTADSTKGREAQIAALDEYADIVGNTINQRFGFQEWNADEAKAFSTSNKPEILKPIMPGDIFSDIYSIVPLGWDESPMFPMGIVAPGTESEYAAYVMPNNGRIPNRIVEGDEITISTYRIANAIDWNIKYSRQARVDVVSQATSVFGSGFTMKMNDDAWHTLLAAGVDRGLLVYDSAGTAGVFSKKLIQLLQLAMIRNGGGNGASVNGFRLTDLYISPEAMEDIRTWTATDLSEESRRQMEVDADGMVKVLFGINLHLLTELGESQKYQNYYTNTLSGTVPGSQVEVVVGLDRSKPNTFMMPVRGDGIEVHADESLLRSGSIGIWGDTELGFAVMDSRAVMLGCF